MHKLIIQNNKKCQIICSDSALLWKLRNFLSFKMAGVEYTQAYQNGWDGITFLMSKNGTFSSGLLSKVELFLREHGVVTEIEDRRAAVVPMSEIDLLPKLKQLGMVPRDYQNEIVQRALANRKGIVRSCTGSGKTLCTAIIAAKLNKPTIIYVIGLDLLKQFHDLFSELFDEPIGYIGNGICKIERINIATIWTVGRTLQLDKTKITLDEDGGDEESFDESQVSRIVKMLEATKVHIFDESHVIATDTIKAIYKVIDPEYIYGFSGTPFRDDNTDLLINGVLGEQIVDIKASRLIEAGFLARPIIKFMPVPKLYISSNQYQSIYKAYVVENETRNQLIIDSIQKLLDKKYTPLVLFKQIKHGDILLALARDSGMKCEMLYGNDTLQRRTEVKEMLRTGEISVLFASTIFDLGIDLPFLNALLLCGGGKSSIRALQRIGRVIRAFPGKKFAAVVDFYDQAKFLDSHSRARYRVYTSEDGFDVSWPTEIKKPRKSKKKDED